MDSKNDSFLPHFITEEIYSIDTIEKESINTSSLNKAEETKPVYEKSSEPETVLILEGGNKKGVLILVNYPNEIPETEKAFLFKILSAINLVETDIALINLGLNQTNEHHKLVTLLPCEVVIAFGTNFESIFPNETPLYKLTQLKKYGLIKSDSLTQVINDTSKKKLLWEQLKSLIQS